MELRLISTTYEGKERITKEQTIPFAMTLAGKIS